MNKGLLTIEAGICYRWMKKYLNKSKDIHLFGIAEIHHLIFVRHGELSAIYSDNRLYNRIIKRFIINVIFSKSKSIKNIITFRLNDVKCAVIDNTSPKKSGILLANHINGMYDSWEKDQNGK